MATSRILPAASNPYSQGATIFDSTPYTQFVLNKQAREEANRNAFIKGFQDIASNVNGAGLDNNDVQDLYNKKAAWQQYVMGHQKEYQNPSLDNGKTYAEANRLYNDAAQHIALGKQKMANIAEAQKILGDPTKSDLLNESFHQKLENARKPISTMGKQGGYQPIDYSDIYNPKPFDENKYRQTLTPLTKDEVTYGTPQKTNQEFYYQTPKITTPKYELKTVENHAENEYNQNPNYRRMIGNIAKSPDRYQEYNDIYKKAYGKNLDIEHPEQLAIAHTLSLLPQVKNELGKPEINAKEYGDYTRKMGEQNKIFNINLNKNGQGQQQQEGNLFDNIGGGTPISIGKDKSMKDGIITLTKDNSPYNGEVYIPKEFIPSNIYSALKSSGADENVLLGNKGFTATIKNGRIEGLKDKYLGYIDRQSMANAQLKYNTEPTKGTQMQFGQKSVSSPKSNTTPTKKKPY